MGLLTVVLCFTRFADNLAKPLPLDLHHITATDAVIKDGTESYETAANYLKPFKTDHLIKKQSKYKRYDLPEKEVPITTSTFEAQYNFNNYNKEEEEDQTFENNNELTKDFYAMKAYENVETSKSNPAETSTENADFGIYHFEMFDAMDALIHTRESRPTIKGLMHEPQGKLKLFEESPRVLNLTIQSQKPTTMTPDSFARSLITKLSSSSSKLKYNYTPAPVQLILPDPPKHASISPEIPKTLQLVFKSQKLQEQFPPTLPSLRQLPSQTKLYETVTPIQSNSNKKIFYKINFSKPDKKTNQKKQFSTEMNHPNYIPSLDDYNAPSKVTIMSTKNNLPPQAALISTFNHDKSDPFRSTLTQEQSFQTTSEIYTPPFRTQKETSNVDTFENFDYIDYIYDYYPENRVSKNEKFSLKDFNHIQNRARNQKNIKANYFPIPLISNDPLLNLLAFGTVFGMAMKSIGGIPFDVVNVELRDLRKKRSDSG